jgi:hypothetical protein
MIANRFLKGAASLKYSAPAMHCVFRLRPAKDTSI